MTDRDKVGLRNGVKSCCKKLTYSYPDGERVMYTDYTLSPEGHLLEWRHRNPGGPDWSIVYRYDEAGRLLEKVQSGDNPVPWQYFSYHYDLSGRLTQVMLSTPEEGERVFESLRYAADGTKTKTSYPVPLEGAICADSMLHHSTDTFTITMVLDEKDRPLRKILYDIDDRVIRKIGYRYDARGLLLEEGELIGGVIRDDLRNVYRYDALGRLIESESMWADFGRKHQTNGYNERGNLAHEIVTQYEGSMFRDVLEDSEIIPWTQRFVYWYDDHHNWIERKIETIASSGEARLDMIEQRELTYYL